jgi:hypothetical protein
MPIDLTNKHGNRFLANLEEVGRLKQIHTKLTKKGPGRKHDVEVLHKSSIVLLCACWEAFIEDLSGSSLAWMILHAKDHSCFPKPVLERVASKYSGMKAWDLAGDGWKQALKDNFKEMLAKTTGTLNTPRKEQVDELFLKTIGLSALSSSWHWKGRSASQVSQALNDLITLRGSIAHRVAASQAVRLKDVEDNRDLVCRLAVKSHNSVCAFLKSQYGTSPWKTLVYGKTK